MARLTAARIRTLKTPGRHGDGDGLHLKISETGARSWILRVVIAGKRRDIGLGRYPDVGLAQAREAAAKHRSLIADGADPIAEKRKAAIRTFRAAAELTFEANKPRWRNGKHTATWWRSLERHAFPILGDAPVDQIGREDVLRVLTPTWGVRMEKARRVRQRIRAIPKWAMAHDKLFGNPLAPHRLTFPLSLDLKGSENISAVGDTEFHITNPFVLGRS